MEHPQKLHKLEDIINLNDGYAYDVAPLGDETLLPFPDKTETQELLELPISLESRIAHLSSYNESSLEPHSEAQIRASIGAPERWVNRTAEHIGLQTASRLNTKNHLPETVYISPGLELLAEEFQWHTKYAQLDDKISEHVIELLVNRDPVWIRAMAEELEIYPDLIQDAPQHFKRLYPKKLATQLRHIILLYPPAHSELTVHTLAQKYSAKWDWVKRRLDKSGFTPKQMWSPHTHELLYYYPVECDDFIGQAVVEKAPPAGDWLTAHGIAKKLSRTFDWVTQRLIAYKETSEMRLDDRGAEAPHYPPEVVAILEQEANAENAYPDAGTFLALTALAKSINRSPLWVQNRLPYTDISPELRWNTQPRQRRLREYYDPEDGQKLLALPDDILKRPKE